MSVRKINTICYCLIRDDLIERSLETLYANTEPNFYVIVIDQTYDGLDVEHFRNKFPDLMIIRSPKTDKHPTGNLGFAKCFNLGLSLCETEYFTTCNDDIEFIGDWFQGVLDTFDKVDKATPERPCILVTPSSVKLPDWSVGRPKGDDFYIMPYKKNYTQEDYDWLVNEEHYVNEHLTIKPDTVIDGITLYLGVGKAKLLREVGGLSEKYYPGSGEDYSFCCRTNMIGYRSVGTTLSWCFHHWSQTFKSVQENEKVKSLIDQDLCWNQTNEEWGEGFDLWGRKCSICQENMRCGEDKTKATCSKNHEQYEMPEVVKVDL